MSPPPPIDAARVRRARRRLLALGVGLTGAGITLLGVLALNAESLAEGFDGLGVAGAPALAAVGALLIVLMVPAGLVAGAAGFVGGTLGGTLAALVATALGAGAAAALGRWVATPDARHVFGARVERAVTWFEARPVQTTVTARLVPGTPFNATSYVLGITRIPLPTIALGSAVGFAPRSFAYAALGGSLRDLGSPEARAAIAASVVLVVLVALVPRLALGKVEPGAAGKEEIRHG